MCVVFPMLWLLWLCVLRLFIWGGWSEGEDEGEWEGSVCPCSLLAVSTSLTAVIFAYCSILLVLATPSLISRHFTHSLLFLFFLSLSLSLSLPLSHLFSLPPSLLSQRTNWHQQADSHDLQGVWESVWSLTIAVQQTGEVAQPDSVSPCLMM